MVTKLQLINGGDDDGSVLAKIHMVTKLRLSAIVSNTRSVLAKIHMVTKHLYYAS